MSAMPRIPARPTMRNGVMMRSRLEARAADKLERIWRCEAHCGPRCVGNCGEVTYEPHAFASGGEQYLPDFRVRCKRTTIYVEVKNASFGAVVTADDPGGELARLLQRMATTIWPSEPGAQLLVLRENRDGDSDWYSVHVIGDHMHIDWPSPKRRLPNGSEFLEVGIVVPLLARPDGSQR